MLVVWSHVIFVCKPRIHVELTLNININSYFKKYKKINKSVICQALHLFRNLN